jgi:hypothetical protein
VVWVDAFSCLSCARSCVRSWDILHGSRLAIIGRCICFVRSTKGEIHRLAIRRGHRSAKQTRPRRRPIGATTNLASAVEKGSRRKCSRCLELVGSVVTAPAGCTR